MAASDREKSIHSEMIRLENVLDRSIERLSDRNVVVGDTKVGCPTAVHFPFVPTGATVFNYKNWQLADDPRWLPAGVSGSAPRCSSALHPSVRDPPAPSAEFPLIKGLAMTRLAGNYTFLFFLPFFLFRADRADCPLFLFLFIGLFRHFLAGRLEQAASQAKM